MEKINYDEIDEEIRELVLFLNKVKGAKTTCCCFGHGKESTRIWLKFNSIHNLNRFLWAGCWRWFNINNRSTDSWELLLVNGDTNRESKTIVCVLQSREIGNQEQIDEFTLKLRRMIESNIPWEKYSLQNYFMFILRPIRQFFRPRPQASEED